MLDRHLAELAPFVARLEPRAAGLIEVTFLLDRLGVVDLRFRRPFLEDARALAPQPLRIPVHPIHALLIPLFADEPIVPIVGRDFAQWLGNLGAKIFISLEQPAILLLFVRATDFLTDKPAQVPQEL